LAINAYFLIRIGRFYDSRSSYDSPFGYGWSLTFNQRLFTYPDGSIMLRKDCGVRHKFVESGNAYVTPVGERGTLTENPDGTFSFAEDTGLILTFDLNGRLSTVEDANGNKLEMTYDPLGKLPLIGKSPYSITPDVATVVAYDYHLTHIEEYNASGVSTGRYVDIEYSPGNGRVSQISDHTARVWIYGFDDAGNLISVTDDLGNTLTYTYADPNDMHNLTEVSGGVSPMTITYDTSSRAVEQTLGELEIDVEYTVPLVQTTITQSVKEGAVVVKEDVNIYEFNENGNPLKIIDNDGNERRYTRNAIGQITSDEFWVDDGGGLAMQEETAYTYDSDGHVLTQVYTDFSTGKVVDAIFTYDEDRMASRYSHDGADPTKVFKEEWTYSHDIEDNPVNVTAYRLLKNPGGDPEEFLETQIFYNANGRPTQIDYPTGTSDIMTYANGYVISSNGVTYGRDLRGNIISLTKTKDTITYVYDNLDRLTEITEGLRTTTYDYSGYFLTGITNPDYSITYAYDGLGRLATVTRTDGGGDQVIASISYDKTTDTVTLTDVDSVDHVYPYDPLTIWQPVEDPSTQSPLPTVIPATSVAIPPVPDPLRDFYQEILEKE